MNQTMHRTALPPCGMVFTELEHVLCAVSGSKIQSATTFKHLTAEVHSPDHLDTVQHSAGKPWILASMLLPHHDPIAWTQGFPLTFY